MPKLDSGVDEYIAKSAEFAKPILQHLRELVHKAAPNIEETLKWSCPHFIWRGNVCSMAAFKAHCTFGFWKRDLIIPPGQFDSSDHAMGQFGRITRVGDLPPDKVIVQLVRKAIQLNEEGVKPASRPKSKTKTPLFVPVDLKAALRGNQKAREVFEGFSYSHQKEYIEWLTEAKREETRARRLETAIEWMAAGKPRHWKYTDC